MPLIWRNSGRRVLAFRDLSPAAPRVRVMLDGQALDLPEGANLAAALLGAGVTVFRRTPVSGAPRGPFCMMGACFECLIEVEGVTRQACMMQVAAGMVLTRPGGKGGA
jgi:D-hydroxyproline dehydrogenase subunit gamma